MFNKIANGIVWTEIFGCLAMAVVFYGQYKFHQGRISMKSDVLNLN